MARLTGVVSIAWVGEVIRVAVAEYVDTAGVLSASPVSGAVSIAMAAAATKGSTTSRQRCRRMRA